MWFCSLKPTSDQDMYGDIWKKVFFFLYSVKKPTKQKNNALYIYKKKKNCGKWTESICKNWSKWGNKLYDYPAKLYFMWMRYV